MTVFLWIFLFLSFIFLEFVYCYCDLCEFLTAWVCRLGWTGWTGWGWAGMWRVWLIWSLSAGLRLRVRIGLLWFRQWVGLWFPHMIIVLILIIIEAHPISWYHCQLLPILLHFIDTHAIARCSFDGRNHISIIHFG